MQAAADSAHPASREALARLCQVYWPAIYAFIRSRGQRADTARELTQGFFTQLLEKKSLKAARPERGRFRSFLLASAKHYVTGEWKREHRQKRGGGVSLLPFDFDEVESQLGGEAVERQTPEAVFEKRWAISVLREAMRRLEADMQRAGKGEMFRQLRPLLTAEGKGYKAYARDLEMSESALRVAVHRLRRSLGELLRDEVAQTLSDPALLDEEMRHLRVTLAS